ncbi:hypothetical protein FA15DRAFT_696760, partial [Coprinopsis marcescibilis]
MARKSSLANPPRQLTISDMMLEIHQTKGPPGTVRGAPKQKAAAKWFKAISLVKRFRISRSRKPTSSTPNTMVIARPLFALVIGIDSYTNISSQNLVGACSDADAFETYLKTDLGVSAEKIISLRNSEATRSGIISGLTALATQNIQPDDAVVLYYAGLAEQNHDGPAYLIPRDWSDSKQQPVEPISMQDWTSFISEVERRSKNVTMIFDCGGDQQSYRGEAGSRSRGIVTGLKGKTTVERSDVPATKFDTVPLIFSACSRGESAIEDKGKGRFTDALLKMLRRNGAVPLSPSKALYNIPQIAGQNPQCSNVSSNLSFLDNPKGSLAIEAYPVSYTDERLTLSVGSALGIAPGSRFAIYQRIEDISTSTEPIMTCEAELVAAFSTTLKSISTGPVSPLGPSAVAIITKAGIPHDLILSTPADTVFKPIHQSALAFLDSERSGTESYRLWITSNENVSDLGIKQSAANSNTFQIAVHDTRATVHGFNELPHPLALDSHLISQFLNKSAHFYRYLNRSYLNNAIGKGVIVEIFRLEESDTEFDDEGFGVLFPVTRNLFQSGVAHLEIGGNSEESPNIHGFKITNNTSHDLYPSVFYFDNSDLSIANYYPKEKASEVLKKNGGSLTLGYNHVGPAGPFSFFLDERQSLDVGFLKVLFTTKPTDLGFIAQESAFKPLEEGAEIRTSSKEAEGVWGSVLYTIVQRRAE